MSPAAESFHCGPLEIELRVDAPDLRDAVAQTFELHDVPWPEPSMRVGVHIRRADQSASPATGDYLVTGRMRADRTPTGIRATCDSGARAELDAERAHWSIELPDPVPEDAEHLALLITTTAWRQLGWIPLHAGAVMRGASCALVCAPSGGGKSTLLAALIRRGATTLGDDKLLLRGDGNGEIQAHALVHNMNLHPRSRDWFPEVGDLEQLPPYSAWTPKRKVAIGSFWPDAPSTHATPTHLIALERAPAGGNVGLRPLSSDEVLSILMRQTVFPNDPEVAQSILGTLAGTARQLQGYAAAIPEGAYENPVCLEPLESLLQ